MSMFNSALALLLTPLSLPFRDTSCRCVDIYIKQRVTEVEGKLLRVVGVGWGWGGDGGGDGGGGGGGGVVMVVVVQVSRPVPVNGRVPYDQFKDMFLRHFYRVVNV